MICISITAATNEEMLRLIAKAGKEGADLYELRLDELSEPPEVENLIRAADKPCIVRCCSTSGHGSFRGTSQERHDIFLRAVRARAGFIDVEPADVPTLAGKTGNTILICSLFDFYGTPSNLKERVRELAALPCDWVKFVVTNRGPADNVAVFEALKICRKPCIGLARGEGGLVTRVLGLAYGSRITYGDFESGFEQVPGKPTVKDLAEIYRVKDLTDSTKVYGVMGNPVDFTRSFRLHNRAFQKLGIDAVFIPFWTESVDDFLAVIPAALNVQGLAVSMPYKMAALRWAELSSENAQRIGAADTLTLTENGWRANNNELHCIFEVLKDAVTNLGINLTGADALVLGSGGTARAVGVALTLVGCRITVASVDHEAAWRLGNVMDWDVEDWKTAPLGRYELVANTTPVGLYPKFEESPYPADAWKEGMVAFDVVHNPQQTRFLKDAAAHGAMVIDGVELFLKQVARQFEQWTGEPMPSITSLTWRWNLDARQL